VGLLTSVGVNYDIACVPCADDADRTLPRSAKDASSGHPSAVEARARFLARLDAHALTHYVGVGSPDWVGAQMVALITNLPPEWLHDSPISPVGLR
jgi:hypothetical protein